jgi:hypothetical protein
VNFKVTVQGSNMFDHSVTSLSIDVESLLLADDTVKLLVSLTCRDYSRRLVNPKYDGRMIAKYCDDAVIDLLRMRQSDYLLEYKRQAVYSFTQSELKLITSRLGYIACAEHRTFEMIDFLHHSGVEWSVASLVGAARVGNIELLRYLRKRGCKYNKAVCTAAAKTGSIELMKWMRGFAIEPDGTPSQVWPWDAGACREAARYGHLPLLKWMRSGEAGDVCDWDYDTLSSAIASNSIDTISWCLDNGCPSGDTALGIALDWCNLETIKYIYQRGICQEEISNDDGWICQVAAARGEPEVLKWCVSVGCQLKESACVAAAIDGNIDMLECCRLMDLNLARNGKSRTIWTALVCAMAAEYGGIAAVLWLRGRDIVTGTSRNPICPWDARVCQSYAGGGSLGDLGLIRDTTLIGGPAPWDATACAQAAAFGNFDILKWLRESEPSNPCPWDATAFLGALTYGSIDMLEYCHINGCDWNPALNLRRLPYEIQQWCADRNYTGQG